MATLKQLLCAFIFSRLNYCNAVLYGLPHSTISPPQRVQCRTLPHRSHLVYLHVIMSSGTERTALVASHLSDPVQSGVNVHGPRQQMPSVPQRLCCLCRHRQWTRTTPSLFGHQPKVRSSTYENQMWRESLFCFWAHCLEQSAFAC